MRQPIVAEGSDEDVPPQEVPQETQEIPYPELPKGAEYLVSLLHSAGTATQTGMGLIPLSWQEIQAWVVCSGLEDSVTPWELGVVRRLSEAYSSEYAQAQAPRRPMPYQPVVEEIDREAVQAKIISIFAQFKKKK